MENVFCAGIVGNLVELVFLVFGSKSTEIKDPRGNKSFSSANSHKSVFSEKSGPFSGG